MNPPQTVSSKPSPSIHVGGKRLPDQFRRLAIFTLILALCFAKPLYDLVRFAFHSDLYSHILLIPVVSFYLCWLRKDALPPDSEPNRRVAAFLLGVGVLVILSYAVATHSGLKLARVDSLCWTTSSFLLLFVGACFLCLGKETLRALAFPLIFLLFIVPFPAFVTGWIETFLQYTSALVSYALFSLTGMPVFRHGLFFQLPGISIEVAPECSGIHSSLVLFVTSLIAGELFLTTGWKRALLSLAVIPLGILRNAVRICTIGYLCVHISPEMIDSPIHHRGGPLFFAVALVPFFALLYFLRRSESKRKAQTTVTSES